MKHNIITKITIIGTVLISFATANFLKQEVNNYDLKSITECLIQVAHANIYKQPVIALLQDNKHESEFVNEMIALIAAYNIPYVLSTLKSNITRFHETNDLNKANSLIVIYLEKCNHVTHSIKFDAEIKYTIITHEYCMKELEKYADAYDEFDIVIILIEESRRHTLITYISVVDEKTCVVKNHNDPVVVGTCYNGTLNCKNGVFLLKYPSNLKKCPIKVGVSLIQPFASAKKVGKHYNMEPLEALTGSDIIMLKIIADHINAELSYYYINRFNDYEEFLINGSLEICAGGLFMRPQYEDLVQYSGSYTTQNIIWIYFTRRTPMAFYRISLILSRLGPFFLIYIIYCVSFSLCNYWSGFKTNLNNILLYSWGTSFGSSRLITPNTSTQVLLNFTYSASCFYLLLFLNLNVYRYITMRLPPKMYNSHEEMLKSGKNIYLITTWDFHVQIYKELQNKSGECLSLPDCEMKALENDGATITTARSFVALEDATSIGDEAIVLKVPGNLYLLHNDLVIRKDSPSLKIIQNLVKRMIESGISRKLFLDAIGTRLVDKTSRMSKKTRRIDYRCRIGCRINITKLEPLFYIWAFGCFISTVIFVLELFEVKFLSLD